MRSGTTFAGPHPGGRSSDTASFDGCHIHRVFERCHPYPLDRLIADSRLRRAATYGMSMASPRSPQAAWPAGRAASGWDARSFRLLRPREEESIHGRFRRHPRGFSAEWRATEAAIVEIESEIPYPLSRVVTDIEAALQRKSFHDRIAEKLTA
jgi:hypothetical protein